jgi:FKBP-type peptidyl-prolyl cis-trans isomerase FkpA
MGLNPATHYLCPKNEAMKKNYWLMLLVPVCLWACTPKIERVDQAAIDDELIRNFLTTNNLQTQRDASGIYYRITTPGPATTPSPVLNDTVQAHYTGTFLNGNVFDTSRPGQPAKFALNRVIVGWQIMLSQMRVGERRIMYVPSSYAYGTDPLVNQATGQVIIPANAVLIFDVELLGVIRRR